MRDRKMFTDRLRQMLDQQRASRSPEDDRHALVDRGRAHTDSAAASGPFATARAGTINRAQLEALLGGAGEIAEVGLREILRRYEERARAIDKK